MPVLHSQGSQEQLAPAGSRVRWSSSITHLVPINSRDTEQSMGKQDFRGPEAVKAEPTTKFSVSLPSLWPGGAFTKGNWDFQQKRGLTSRVLSRSEWDAEGQLLSLCLQPEIEMVARS